MNSLWVRQKNSKSKTSSLEELLQAFIRVEFSDVVDSLPPADYADLKRDVLCVLHSHRYKKADSVPEYDGIDFNLVRDVLYRYTLDA